MTKAAIGNLLEITGFALIGIVLLLALAGWIKYGRRSGGDG